MFFFRFVFLVFGEGCGMVLFLEEMIESFGAMFAGVNRGFV